MREAWDKVSVNRGVRWCLVVPRIACEKKVIVVVTRLIMGLEIQGR